MHVVVLGSGLAGIASAWYLARAGARVTVLGRGLAPDAGLAVPLSSAYLAPWAAPELPLRALRELLRAPTQASWPADGFIDRVRWLLATLASDRRARAASRAQLIRLASYSRDCLRALCAETGLRYAQRRAGTLHLFRQPQRFAAAARDCAALHAHGVDCRVLDRDRLGTHLALTEPALAVRTADYAGALLVADDEAADPTAFARQLADWATSLGVRFRHDVDVRELVAAGDRLLGVRIGAAAGGEIVRADRYLLTAGERARALARTLGLDLPVHTLQAHALRLPLTAPAGAAHAAVVDRERGLTLVRVPGLLQIGMCAAPWGLAAAATRRPQLEAAAHVLLPAACELGAATYAAAPWAATPDGPPVVGATPYRELFLNTGHGALGWSLACGCGQLVADLITGQRPAIRHDDLAPARYRRTRAALTAD